MNPLGLFLSEHTYIKLFSPDQSTWIPTENTSPALDKLTIKNYTLKIGNPK
jgi:hypothetical protein